ncbi:hypothetical protein FOMPIDRAFT_1123279 [Fomitopsis schrenkii]|uniref:Uncharacterized protein n=1 Tax=Fomitopsis schrenkii TaxID=2126942 RepID=S8E5X1_FOMSC|nr:hypothetical protein FOMPIDRAFT_1123279 [Fomitopsis schrenkii]
MSTILPFISARALALIFCLFFPSLVLAELVYRFIDDEWGDPVTGLKPVYSVNWNYGPDCPVTFCFVRPDQTKTFNGTWHHTMSSAPSTAGHQVTIGFTGIAISVYGVMANPPSQNGSVLFTNATFELDGEFVGTYSHFPNSNADQFEYNVTIFSVSGLSNTNHTLVVTDAQGSELSLLLFDYAKYT